ncbi:MAG: DUF1572 family protein [Gemmatimonadota bacterium]
MPAVRAELTRLRALAEGALVQVDDRAFFHADSPEENSLAVLVKHLAGNMRSRWTEFLTTDGEKPDRHRDSEFVIEETDTRAALMERWEHGWETLLGTIDALGPGDLQRTVRIRGEPHTVLQALERQQSHYAYHVGQIVQLARHLAGEGWKTLSIPRGGSAAFNRESGPYLAE